MNNEVSGSDRDRTGGHCHSRFLLTLKVWTMKVFKDRIEAGELLAKKLLPYKNQDDVMVLALPRGGVPVAFQVAKALHVPLDVFLVRKLGVPGQKELAMGAIASGGVTVFNQDILCMIDISPETIAAIQAEELNTLKYRENLYRRDRPALTVKDKTIILVDDGIATGATMRVAIKALKKLQCQKIIVAVPVAPADTCEQLAKEADDIICLEKPSPFYAIGGCYVDFSQTTDEEVRNLLARAL